MMYGIVLVLVVAMTGLLGFWLRRPKQHTRQAIVTTPTAQGEIDAQTYCDDFYCIMLTDGTTRTGFISQPKAKQDS